MCAKLNTSDIASKLRDRYAGREWAVAEGGRMPESEKGEPEPKPPAKLCASRESTE